MSKSEISWVHLSDFHVGMDSYSQRKLFSEVVKFLGDEVSAGNAIDFIFITGDIANRGQHNEYEEFLESFLIPLDEVLGTKWEGRILTVPGNHDVDRVMAPHFRPRDILANSQGFFDPTADGKQSRSQFIPRFLEYSNSDYAQAPLGWLNSDSAAYDVAVSFPCGEVAIIGVNSAWLSKDEFDRHLLTPGSNILEDALARHSSARLKIVLGHHPLSWMDDAEAQRIRTILAKHHAIYLCGHLHEADTRYEDGGTGAFLSLQSGAAFQVRPEDQPKLVNGFQRVRVDLEEHRLLVQALHWSDTHRQWKVSTDAFVNERKSEIRDWWAFPIPNQNIGQNEIRSPSHPSAISFDPKSAPPNGWSVIDRSFLEPHGKPLDRDVILQYFDGRPPDWSSALSSLIPRRQIVSELRARFVGLSNQTKPYITVVLGAGGEGKSTALFQTIVDLVQSDNWIVLFRYGDESKLNWTFVEQCSKTFEKVLIATDDAHSFAEGVLPLLGRLASSRCNNVHFFLCARTIDWRAEVRDQKEIIELSQYQEIVLRGLSEPDAADLIDAWSEFGKEGLNELYSLPKADAVKRLVSAAIDNAASESDEGALLGAMLQMRYGDKLKDKVRSILYRIRNIQAPAGTLLDAFAMIAAMHAKELRADPRRC